MLIHMGTGNIEFPDLCKPVRQIMVLPYLAFDGSARGSTGVAWWAACSCHAQSTKHLDSKRWLNTITWPPLHQMFNFAKPSKTYLPQKHTMSEKQWKTICFGWLYLRFFLFSTSNVVIIVRLRRGSCRTCSCDGFRRRLPSWLGEIVTKEVCLCVCMCVFDSFW